MESEKVLIKKLFTQNQDAFQEIYEIYKRLVEFVIYRIVKDKEAVKELVQDTFIKVWKNIHSFQIDSNFQAWILTIAKNCARDYLKTNKGFDFINDIEIVSNYFSEKKLYEFYIDVKGILTDFECDVLVYTMICNMTRQELADYLKRPLGTVLRTYYETINKLRVLYGPK
jgi:RNA polymerase sigma-70 factor (ECF subfamily)